MLSRFYSAFAAAFVGKFYRTILEEVKRANPSSILDVGCGPGIIIRMIASEIKGADLYCIDPSESMIARANRRLARYSSSGRVHARTGSSRDIPFERKYDMIITSLSYHHWKDREESLPYLLEKLSDNGVLSIFEMNGDNMKGLYRAGRGHSLSEDYANSLEFPGYRREVKLLGNGRILNIRFSKDTGSS